ncbi:MAG: nicotinamide-nucleotide amidase [Glaciecola sp.]
MARLRVGICAVGTELVLGDQLDTNSAWLSSRMRQLGAEVVAHVSASDDLLELVPALRWLADRTDVVLVCGGLGPTQDDRTREAVAELAGVELRSRPELEEALVQRFAQLGRRMPPSNLRQARLPVGADAFSMQGTAPGFALIASRTDGGSCWVACFPGVPWELEAMFDADALPVLLQRSGGGATVTRMLIVTAMAEASVGEALADLSARLDAHPDAELSYLAKKGEIHVRVTARAATPHEAADIAGPFIDEAADILGHVVGARDGETLESALLTLLAKREQTVAIAESATAGGVAARLATVPGASQVLRGGLVLYATDTKAQFGGVDAELLAKHGPVSVEVTEQLALSVREKFGAHWGVALTGVAGPAQQNGQPVGHTIVAVAGPGGVVSQSGGYPGDRVSVQRRMTTFALELLRREVLGITPGDGAR